MHREPDAPPQAQDLDDLIFGSAQPVPSER